LDNSIGVTAAFSNGLEGKCDTSQGRLVLKLSPRIKHREHLSIQTTILREIYIIGKNNILAKRTLNVHPLYFFWLP